MLVYEGAIPNSFGDQYTKLSAENDQFHFIPLSEYAWKTAVLSLLLLLFLYGLYLCFSYVIKNPPVNLLIVGAIVLGGMKWLPVSRWNPFTYADIHRVLNGELAALTINPSIQFENGVLLLSIIGVVLIGMNALLFRFATRQ